MPAQDDPAAALLRSNRRRRLIRRWVAIGTIPLTLAALLFVGKLLSMYAFAHQAITAYVVDDFAGSEASARGQDVLNWFEPYKAPYNIGTALAGADELPASRAELERSLDLATGLEVCPVRINLALVIERMGDAARADGDGAGATALYGEALTVTVETPEECRSDEAQQQSPTPSATCRTPWTTPRTASSRSSRSRSRNSSRRSRKRIRRNRSRPRTSCRTSRTSSSRGRRSGTSNRVTTPAAPGRTGHGE